MSPQNHTFVMNLIQKVTTSVCWSWLCCTSGNACAHLDIDRGKRHTCSLGWLNLAPVGRIYIPVVVFVLFYLFIFLETRNSTVIEFLLNEVYYDKFCYFTSIILFYFLNALFNTVVLFCFQIQHIPYQIQCVFLT